MQGPVPVPHWGHVTSQQRQDAPQVLVRVHIATRQPLHEAAVLGLNPGGRYLPVYSS
jgi:hypothetical protein